MKLILSLNIKPNSILDRLKIYMFTNENTKMVTSHLFWNVEDGESLCKDESKTRAQSHAKDMCTNEATAVLLTVERKQYKLESERSGK